MFIPHMPSNICWHRLCDQIHVYVSQTIPIFIPGWKWWQRRYGKSWSRWKSRMLFVKFFDSLCLFYRCVSCISCFLNRFSIICVGNCRYARRSRAARCPRLCGKYDKSFISFKSKLQKFGWSYIYPRFELIVTKDTVVLYGYLKLKLCKVYSRLNDITLRIWSKMKNDRGKQTVQFRKTFFHNCPPCISLLSRDSLSWFAV